MALASEAVKDKPRLRGVLLAVGIFGTSLFYGDGVITPAISVLSAVEGLEVVSTHFTGYVIPITLVVLFGLFATLALLLSALGIYAVVSYKVALETRDIGVRMALGASRLRVLGEVCANGCRLAVLAVGLGLAAALGFTRHLASQLYEVSATDPLTFAAVPLLFMVIALLSCLPAARRAASVEPMAALRQE